MAPTLVLEPARDSRLFLEESFAPVLSLVHLFKKTNEKRRDSCLCLEESFAPILSPVPCNSSEECADRSAEGAALAARLHASKHVLHGSKHVAP